MRGVNHEWIRGYLEAKVETYANANGLNLQLLLEELATEILRSVGQGRGEDSLPSVRNTPSQPFVERSQVEVGKHAQRRSTRALLETSSKPSQTAGTTRTVSKVGSGGYWAKMTPKQRSNEMKRRMLKWSPEAKKAWGKKRVKSSS